MAGILEIDKAIGAHAAWKAHLKTAIDTGKTDAPIETIRKDDQCAFGKWLLGPALTSADKGSDHYKAVKILHAEFHIAAAAVATLATDGKRTEAEKMIASGGEFTVISSKLTLAMMAWRAVSK